MWEVESHPACLHSDSHDLQPLPFLLLPPTPIWFVKIKIIEQVSLTESKYETKAFGKGRMDDFTVALRNVVYQLDSMHASDASTAGVDRSLSAAWDMMRKEMAEKNGFKSSQIPVKFMILCVGVCL